MRRCVSLLAFLTIALSTGCSGPVAPPPTGRQSLPGPAALVASEPSPDSDVDSRMDDSAAEAEALKESWLAPDPGGTTAHIALRFLQALQRQDDLGALLELSHIERGRIADEDVWALHRVMNDVRRHAHLDGSGPCRFAKAFDENDVLVACGRQRVMVHLDPPTAFGGGVQVFPASWSPFGGGAKYRYAHTRAYSSVRL